MDPQSTPPKTHSQPDKMVYFKLDGRPVKKIERKALYTHLEARVNYLKDFLDFNSSTQPIPPSPLKTPRH